VETASRKFPSPEGFAMIGNFPNPFNASTRVLVQVSNEIQPQRDGVSIEIRDLSGRHVRRIFTGILRPGVHSFHWDGTDESGNPMSSGVYICRLKAGPVQVSRKICCIR
jgi:flagellar hook assembly protein FlgD